MQNHVLVKSELFAFKQKEELANSFLSWKVGELYFSKENLV